MPSRMDAVFILVMSIFSAGAVLLLSSKKFRTAKDVEPLKKLALLFAIGGVASLIGIINLVLVHRSGRSSTTGVIAYLIQHHGKHDHSGFYLPRQDGSLLRVKCDYAGNHLIPGETVHADVLDYQSTLLHLVVLDGRYAGWTLTEGDGTLGSLTLISCGFTAGLTAWVRRLQVKRSIPPN